MSSSVGERTLGEMVNGCPFWVGEGGLTYLRGVDAVFGEAGTSGGEGAGEDGLGVKEADRVFG